MSKRIPVTIDLLPWQEVVDFAVGHHMVDNEEGCYCKECGKPLTNGAVFWFSKYATQTYRCIEPLQTNEPKKTFMHFRRFNNTNYNLCRCDKCIKKKFPEYKGNLCSPSAKYIQYAFGVSDADFEPVKNLACIRSLEGFIRKYGETEGTERWNAYCQKQSESNSFEYKAKKHGWTKEQFDEYNKSRAVTLDNLIKKYGEAEGTMRFIQYCERQAYSCTLDYFLEKYGPDGRKKYENFCEARTNSNNLSAFMRSNIADKFCEELAAELPDHVCHYGMNEYQVGPYFVDFYDETTNTVVEFYGDYWHRNPDIYEPDSVFTVGTHTYLTSIVWDRDKERIDYIKKTKDCKVIIVWESNYQKEPHQVISDLKEILTGFVEV